MSDMMCARCGRQRERNARYCPACANELILIEQRMRYWRQRNWSTTKGLPVCRYCARAHKQMRTGHMCWDCYYLRAAQRRRADPESYRKRAREWRQAYRNTERGKRSEQEAVKRYRVKHRERYLASQRKSHQRKRANPITHKRELENRRIGSRLRNQVAGERVITALNGYVPAAVGNHSGKMLDAAPLREFLQHNFGSWTTQGLADWLGEDDRHIGRILNGEQQKISLHTADRIFVGADCAHMLAVLYPEAESESEIAA